MFKQTTNNPFEPNFDGPDGNKDFKNDDYGFDEYNFTSGNHFHYRAGSRRPILEKMESLGIREYQKWEGVFEPSL